MNETPPPVNERIPPGSEIISSRGKENFFASTKESLGWIVAAVGLASTLFIWVYNGSGWTHDQDAANKRQDAAIADLQREVQGVRAEQNTQQSQFGGFRSDLSAANAKLDIVISALQRGENGKRFP